MKKILLSAILAIVTLTTCYSQTYSRELVTKAENGDAQAQYELGVCYFNGLGVARDPVEANTQWMLAERGGNAEASFMLGFVCMMTNDVEMGVYHWEKAAKKGHAKAQANLGRCYESGIGVQINIPYAVELFQKAAYAGNPEGQYNLGVCYYEGKGIARNYTRAVDLFRKAAAKEVIQALNNLGRCYYEGTGVTRNYSKAAQYWQEAYSKGDAVSAYNLGQCYENGIGVTRNQTKAKQLYQEAVEAGVHEAQYDLDRLNK